MALAVSSRITAWYCGIAVARSLHTVQVITYVFSSFSLLFLIYSVGSCFHEAKKVETYYVIILYGFVRLVGFGVLVAIYSDWILGAIAGNLAGAPSSDAAISLRYIGCILWPKDCQWAFNKHYCEE